MRRKPTPHPIIRKRKPRPRTNAEHVLTVAEFFDSSAYGGAVRPMIRMRGDWLARIGFRAGEYVIVTAEPKRLVLTIAEE